MSGRLNYFFFVIISLILITGCSLLQPSPHPIIKAEKGTLDLQKWNFYKDGIIRLNGEWEFYWKERASSHVDDKQYITVPSTWKKEKGLSGYGYGTYRLVIDHLQKNRDYALELFTVATSYNLWINGDLVASSGKPGINKQKTIPYYRPQEVYFSTKDTQVEIILEVSNYHYRDGGIWESISFGTADQIKDRAFKVLAFEMIIFGGLLLSGLYHFVLFLQRLQNKSILFLSMVCFIICLRIIVTEKILIIDFFPNIPWSLIIRLEYLSFYISVPLFCWVLQILYPKHVSNRFCWIFTIVSLIFSLEVVFTPTTTFTRMTMYFQIITLLGIIYISIALLKALRDRQEGAVIVNLCAGFLSVTVVNDILSMNSIIHTYKLSSLGLFVFIFSQSHIIANRSAKAFREMERVSNELALLNKTLEEKVRERTISLENSKDELEKVNVQLKNWSYQDQLTQIPNRRYFDEIFEQEFNSAVQKRYSMAIIYADIDYFKLYNDTYGHESGDECLKQVANSLSETLKAYDGQVARIGGEEFISVLCALDEEKLQEVCESCRVTIERLRIPHEASPICKEVTISIGAAMMVPDKRVKGRELIHAADDSLYKAKERGRNQVYITIL